MIGTAVESKVGEHLEAMKKLVRGLKIELATYLEISQELIELGEVPYHQGEPVLGVGLEGGVFEMKKSELWATVWLVWLIPRCQVKVRSQWSRFQRIL